MGHYFLENLETDVITLNSEESKHLIKVLRKKIGDRITFTDGKGNVAITELIDYNKERCLVQVIERRTNVNKRDFEFHLVVAPTKNPDRMEWMVEKAVEIGVEKITFIICERSERKHLDINRMERIAIAALKQSSGTYLPEILLTPFKDFIQSLEHTSSNICKLMAWCEHIHKTPSIHEFVLNQNKIILMIGPEGDFSPNEVQFAQKQGFQEVTLGEKILRTETAAIYGTCAISLLKT
ncbi:MAG TPA: RsmE family RNA methyltransferase [Bacteroidales bacterium]|nr:RsmE family RNA methyltransferase [Bacteroidales bacterium]